MDQRREPQLSEPAPIHSNGFSQPRPCLALVGKDLNQRVLHDPVGLQF